MTDALAAAQVRGALPTDLDTEGLRELGADVLARSVFTARGTNAVFASELKAIIDKLAAGDIGEGQARTAIWEVLDALGYDAERGGFPGEELEPELAGTLKDLKSFRRRDLIVRTQLDLMAGRGEQMRGQTAERLRVAPAWELVRYEQKATPRDWPSRWVIAGGSLADGGRMIALKGDPIWGELGSYDNFSDALGVDHPPFAFNSGMGWREITEEEVRSLGITGPDGETPEEFFRSGPITLSGTVPPALPVPKLSLRGMDPEIAAEFRKQVGDTERAGGFEAQYQSILADAIREGNEAYLKGGQP